MRMPPLVPRARALQLAQVTVLTLIQGLAAGSAAFAVRGLFEILHRDVPISTGLLLVLGASGIVIAVARVAARMLGERLGQSYALDVRQALFQHATRMPASDVAERRNGYMSLRFVGDLSALRDWIGLGLPHLIAAAILIPMAQAVLWMLHPGFGMAVVPIVVIAIAVIALGGARLVPLYQTLRQHRALIAADMVERMPLAPQLRRLGRAKRERIRIRDHSLKMIEASLHRMRVAEALKAWPDVVSACAVIAVIWVGFRDNVSPGTIAGGLAALGISIAPMRELATVWDLRAGFQAAHAKCELALMRRRRAAGAAQKYRADGAYSVEITGLDIGPANDFTLRVSPGETAMLDTIGSHDQMHLFSILSGLEPVAHGSVRINGQAVCDIDQARICVIDIAPPVLRGSLRRAITLGIDPRPKDRDIRRVTKQTGFDATISRMGDLNARVAENGNNLAPIERLRLSLTRAMLSDPAVVLVALPVRVLDAQTLRALHDWIGESGATAIIGGYGQAAR